MNSASSIFANVLAHASTRAAKSVDRPAMLLYNSGSARIDAICGYLFAELACHVTVTISLRMVTSSGERKQHRPNDKMVVDFLQVYVCTSSLRS